ncbi:HNH endonuclease signature motif containing protein [Jiangella gansuensis]|uniref:HNH endonuclease signature motif containing protein n=1 Tax=Jiangella gansuensis TaxID=281473 RepID=UPI00047CFD26|nr:HNH endonuclease signature motif containing protein [Jiangella gansuensis]
MFGRAGTGNDGSGQDPAGDPDGGGGRRPDLEDLTQLPPGPELVAELAGIEVAGLPAHDLVVLAVAWERQKAYAEARQLAVFAALAAQPEYQHCTYPDTAGGTHEHRAVQAAGSEVSLALAWSPGRAAHRVATAVELVEELPTTLDALTAGRIDADKARLITERTRCLPNPDTRRSVEAAVLPVAEHKTRTALDTALRRAVIAADPTGAEQRHRDATDRRRVQRPEPASPGGDDGMAQLYLYGPAEDLTALWTAIDAAAHHARTRARKHGDRRTLDHHRFDTLTGLGWTALTLGHLGCCNPTCTSPRDGTGTGGNHAGTSDSCGTSHADTRGSHDDHRSSAAHGPQNAHSDSVLRLGKRRGRAATVLVTVPITALAGADDQPAHLHGYGPITATTARRITADATLRRLLTDPATGEALEYGHTTYAPPAALAAFVVARDTTCRFPTCARPGTDTDIDHVIPYHQGGTTGAANTWLLHRTHHLDRTHHGHTIHTHSDGTRSWTTPAGFTYPAEPEAVGPVAGTQAPPEPPPF